MKFLAWPEAPEYSQIHRHTTLEKHTPFFLILPIVLGMIKYQMESAAVVFPAEYLPELWAIEIRQKVHASCAPGRADRGRGVLSMSPRTESTCLTKLFAP